MKTRSPLKKVAAVALAASALVGCSVSAPSTIRQPAWTPPSGDLSAPSFQVLVEDKAALKDEHHKKLSEFLTQLALTDAQKTQLKGVIKGAFDRAKMLQSKMKPLVTGPKIDRMTLKSAIAQAMKEDAAQDAQTMEEVRAVLTHDQRMLIADKLSKMGTRADDPHVKLFDKLMDKASEKAKLKEQQKAEFAKLKTSMMGFWMKNRAAYYTAMAAHMKDGDQQKLQAEFERLSQNIPSDAMVSFMASLDQSQRQALIAWKEGLVDKIASQLAK